MPGNGKRDLEFFFEIFQEWNIIETFYFPIFIYFSTFHNVRLFIVRVFFVFPQSDRKERELNFFFFINETRDIDRPSFFRI